MAMHGLMLACKLLEIYSLDSICLSDRNLVILIDLIEAVVLLDVHCRLLLVSLPGLCEREGGFDDDSINNRIYCLYGALDMIM